MNNWDKDISYHSKIDILKSKGLDELSAAEKLAAPGAFGKWDAGLKFSEKVDILSKLPGGNYETALIKMTLGSIKPFKL